MITKRGKECLVLDRVTKECVSELIFRLNYGGWAEKAMAPHSSTLAWKIPWTEEPGGLQSMGSRRVGHGWAISLSLFTFMHWRRKWRPTPVFLPRESQGWGRTESDMTELTAAAVVVWRMRRSQSCEGQREEHFGQKQQQTTNFQQWSRI